jgi:very-short-patch-repair endonuclease
MRALKAPMRSFKSPQVSNRRQIELDQYAWRNRHAPTEAEARLWEMLRGRKLGVQFRRQVPLRGRYIVDFLARKARLVVEVEGRYHAQRVQADARRDHHLRRLGYRVIRIPASLVMTDPSLAAARVASALNPHWTAQSQQATSWISAMLSFQEEIADIELQLPSGIAPNSIDALVMPCVRDYADQVVLGRAAGPARGSDPRRGRRWVATRAFGAWSGGPVLKRQAPQRSTTDRGWGRLRRHRPASR